MLISMQLAKNFRELYFGGNWTAVSFKPILESINLETAIKKTEGLHTILALSFHSHYYVKGTMAVLKGGPLEIKDKHSFTPPNITTEKQWGKFKSELWRDANAFLLHIEQLDEELLNQNFVAKKYGSYYRNISGIIAHSHYHLGQIVLLKKLNSTSN